MFYLPRDHVDPSSHQLVVNLCLSLLLAWVLGVRLNFLSMNVLLRVAMLNKIFNFIFQGNALLDAWL